MKSFRYMLSLNFLQKSGQLLLKWEKLSQRTPRYVQRISRMMILSVSLVYGTYLPAWLRDHICYIVCAFIDPQAKKRRLKLEAVPSQKIPLRSTDKVFTSPQKRQQEKRLERILKRSSGCCQLLGNENELEKNKRSTFLA